MAQGEQPRGTVSGFRLYRKYYPVPTSALDPLTTANKFPALIPSSLPPEKNHGVILKGSAQGLAGKRFSSGAVLIIAPVRITGAT